jgi:hypothetical protein
MRNKSNESCAEHPVPFLRDSRLHDFNNYLVIDNLL